MPTIDDRWQSISDQMDVLDGTAPSAEAVSTLFTEVRDYDAAIREEYEDLSYPAQLALLNRNAARLFKIYNFLRLNAGFYSGDTQAFVDAVSADVDALFNSYLALLESSGYYYATYAAAAADVGNRASGNVGVVIADEGHGGALSYYIHNGTTWVYQPGASPLPIDFSGLTPNTGALDWILSMAGGNTGPTSPAQLKAALALRTSDVQEDGALYLTEERIDDRVAALLQSGLNLTVVYDDLLNRIEVAMTDDATINGGYF